MTQIGVLVGNPRPASRTWHAALALRDAVRRVLSLGVSGAGPLVDAADLAQEVFAPGAEKVRAALAELAKADVLVIATPTYKATYTGLLKAVLDQAPAGWLRGKVVVPLQVAASDRHALAVELHLRPLLVELGGRVAGQGIFLNESELASTPEELTSALVERLDAGALNALVSAPELVS
ncbi:NAD(P)H-dependent FMN reductase [Lentzea atacamensis]|uniref:NAD(P)H-dependent FMN reductase n=1 Tax=Lentzea atacamensis TaxID=531938 RepID=A0A316I1P3_9PSEU|nr:NAD(P)H-dependent oxidoreductase [Lentzea atacamensis]PWK86923.1 NAD(P)H-dependent FMN reductase [Lentzea atacamensis]RAS67271.1 NAD(P)H-dependent FMN reductase [Lentzea atacamensis]